MGRNANALSEKQVATLEWIRDGCPAVDEETEVSRKISAASLKSRGLATVKGAGATWKASITPAGRAWLERHPTAVADAVGGSEGLIARVLAADGRLSLVGRASTTFSDSASANGGGDRGVPARHPRS